MIKSMIKNYKNAFIMWGGGTDIKIEGQKDSERQTKEKVRRGRSRLRSLPPWRKKPHKKNTHTPFLLYAIYSSAFTDLPPWLISFVGLSAGCFSWVPRTLWHTWLWLRARHARMETLGSGILQYAGRHLHNNEFCHLITQKLHQGKFTVIMYI